MDSGREEYETNLREAQEQGPITSKLPSAGTVCIEAPSSSALPSSSVNVPRFPARECLRLEAQGFLRAGFGAMHPGGACPHTLGGLPTSTQASGAQAFLREGAGGSWREFEVNRAGRMLRGRMQGHKLVPPCERGHKGGHAAGHKTGCEPPTDGSPMSVTVSRRHTDAPTIVKGP